MYKENNLPQISDVYVQQATLCPVHARVRGVRGLGLLTCTLMPSGTARMRGLLYPRLRVSSLPLTDAL